MTPEQLKALQDFAAAFGIAQKPSITVGEAHETLMQITGSMQRNHQMHALEALGIKPKSPEPPGHDREQDTEDE